MAIHMASRYNGTLRFHCPSGFSMMTVKQLSCATMWLYKTTDKRSSIFRLLSDLDHNEPLYFYQNKITRGNAPWQGPPFILLAMAQYMNESLQLSHSINMNESLEIPHNSNCIKVTQTYRDPTLRSWPRMNRAGVNMVNPADLTGSKVTHGRIDSGSCHLAPCDNMYK